MTATQQEEVAPKANKTFLIVDGHAVLYRAFHAFPDLTDPQGRQVNAVYGFARLVLKSILDFQPECVAVAFDHHSPTFRHEQYDQYKAHREAMPESLISQISIVKELVTILNIPQYEVSGFEADDLVGTVSLDAENQSKKGIIDLDRTVILTGDSDLLQLVTDFTRVFIPKRGAFGKDKLYDADDVMEKFGVHPTEIPQMKALTGDSSDNIPGVAGIGPKTARTIFGKIDTIDQLYALLDKDEKSLGVSAKIINSLREHKDSAYMSLQLAQINRQAPVSFDASACKLSSYDKAAAITFFEKFAFNSLIKLLPEDELEAGIQDLLF